MGSGNLYEEAADEVARWVNDIVEAAVPEVMGGRRPPWKRELHGVQLREWWDGLGPEDKIAQWGIFSDEDRDEVRKVMGFGQAVSLRSSDDSLTVGDEV